MKAFDAGAGISPAGGCSVGCGRGSGRDKWSDSNPQEPHPKPPSKHLITRNALCALALTAGFAGTALASAPESAASATGSQALPTCQLARQGADDPIGDARVGRRRRG